MNEANNSWLSAPGTVPSTTGYLMNPLNISPSITVRNMKTQQVKVAVFEITRDEDTNEINSTKFVKELWVERKNGTSIDLIVAKQLDGNFDPETTVVKELYSVNF